MDVIAFLITHNSTVRSIDYSEQTSTKKIIKAPYYWPFVASEIGVQIIYYICIRIMPHHVMWVCLEYPLGMNDNSHFWLFNSPHEGQQCWKHFHITTSSCIQSSPELLLSIKIQSLPHLCIRDKLSRHGFKSQSFIRFARHTTTFTTNYDWVWMANYIHYLYGYYLFTPNFNDGFAKQPLARGYVITPRGFTWMWLLIHDLIHCSFYLMTVMKDTLGSWDHIYKSYFINTVRI